MENEMQNQQVTQDSVSSPSTLQPVSPTPKSKLPIILGGLFLMLLVGGGTYYLGTKNSNQTIVIQQNTPTPTQRTSNTPKQIKGSELKTFTSSSMGFTVKYPSEWINKELKNGVSFRPQGNIPNENFGLVTIVTEEKKEGVNLDNYIYTSLCHTPEDCASTIKAEPITVSGLPAKKVLDRPSLVPAQTVVVIKDNKIYLINVTLDKSFEEMYSIEEKETIFNQMISSFTITN